MGRSRRSSRINLVRRNLRITMATKEHLATLPLPDLYKRPDVSVKVVRSLARRRAHYRGIVRPVFFVTEVTLSPLFDRSKNEKYITQVFKGLRKIGQGCFGDVFRGESKEDGQLYAIKVTNDTHPFLDVTEIRRLEKIGNHENCIKFYMAWQETHRMYIQMELCLTSLDKVMVVYHHIGEAQCWEIFADVAQGLKHLHDKELIHLDIKPANIMITAKSVCKIGDFGLLMDLLEEETSSNPERKKKAVTVSEGDGKYVALEVLCEKTYTKAGDIFSLGLMMLEIASDVSLPTSGDHWRDIREGGVPGCYMDRQLSDNFRHLVKEMTLKNYSQRPDINEILANRSIIEVIKNRKQCGRPNFMINWEHDFQEYASNHPEAAFDIPVIQILGPSPPRRPYPINHQHSPSSPIGAQPLQEINVADLVENQNERATSSTEQRYARARTVARRLFNQ